MDESQYGEPEDATITEITGEAPPCEKCGSKPACTQTNGLEVCADCDEELNDQGPN